MDNKDGVDVFASRCRIGEMAARTTTKFGTVTLHVGASSSSNLRQWHGGIFSCEAESFVTTNLQNVTFDLVDLYMLKLSEDCTECAPSFYMNT